MKESNVLTRKIFYNMGWCWCDNCERWWTNEEYKGILGGKRCPACGAAKLKGIPRWVLDAKKHGHCEY